MTSPDPGFFGPESVTWKIQSDPSALVGGLRALYLQALHPVAMTGVAQFSDFDADPWGRLIRTAEYVATTTFGATTEAEQAASRIRGIHSRLSGVDPRTGAGFRVDDPHLLTWVHCCEVDSFLSTAQRAGVRLSPADADRYVAEQRISADLIGIGPDVEVPTDSASLRDYFHEMRPELIATADARRAARFVLAPPMPAWVAFATPARAAWGGLSAMGLALLPRWARRLYRLPGLPTTDLGATVSVRALRAAFLAVPANLREGPALKSARERLAA